MVIQGIKLPTIAFLFALIVALCYDGIRLVYDQQFNDALASGGVAEVNGRADPRRQFAKAYALQQQQDFKAAVKVYAAIDALPHSQLQMDIKFNLANLYFREATRMRDIDSNDLAMPLIELAKQNYREILRIDSGHWDAKYNLELALILAPETDPVDPLEEVNPERSPNALTKTQSREPLP
jgi:mxaK protein